MEELEKKINAQQVKLDLIYKSLERIRKYFLIMTWITVIVIILPLLGLVFAIPMFLTNYVGVMGGLM